MESKTLKTADELIHGERHEIYGDARTDFRRIANLWNAYLNNKPINSQYQIYLDEMDVAILMVLLKIAREQGPVHYPDNAIDACGYLALYNDELVD